MAKKKNKEQKPSKKYRSVNSELIKDAVEARSKHMTYGQLQAKRYIEQQAIEMQAKKGHT